MIWLTIAVFTLIQMMAVCGLLRRGPRCEIRSFTSRAVFPPSWASASSPPSFSNAFQLARDYLLANAVPEAESSARYLLCDVVKTGYRLSDFTRAAQRNPPVILTPNQLQTLSAHCEQRARRKPVQYILGNWDFCGMEFECLAPVLIPRPETEELVERILGSGSLSAGSAILDVGAGTGAIGVSLLAHLQRLEQTAGGGARASCLALDIDPAAASLAMRNAATLLPRPAAYTCLAQSLSLYVSSGSGRGEFDIIVSNPPYIPSREIAGLEPEVVGWESRLALDGGTDGLDVVRELLAGAGPLLRPEGPRELWLEVSRSHPDEIEALVRQELPKPRWRVQEKAKDLSGHPRFVRLNFL